MPDELAVGNKQRGGPRDSLLDVLDGSSVVFVFLLFVHMLVELLDLGWGQWF